jgi:hypothetical protein
MGLLAVLEAPQGAAFGLDQVSVKGVPLKFGGQVAEAIDMVLYAKAKPRVGAPPPMISCRSHCCMPAGTPPGKIASTNFAQPRKLTDACPHGWVDAYPEISPPAGANVTQVMGVLPTTVAQAPSHARTRRAE